MAERLSRREIKHDIKHDKFVEDVNLAYGFVQKNRSRVILAIAGVIGLLAVIAAVWMFRNHREGAAQARLSEAISILEASTASSPDPSAPKPLYKSEEEKTAKATPILQEVTANYGGTDAADVADLYLARIAAAKGDVAAARPKLEAFVKDHPKNILAGGAQISLYQLDINGGKAKDVAAELEKKISASDNILPTDALMALLGRSYEQMGESAKAKEIYQRIATEFPDSPYAMEGQRGGAAGGGSPVTIQ